MKLGLGTVQFGLDYGITNSGGKTPPAEVSAILADAAAHGVDTLDTAALYGGAENALGAHLPRPHAFRIVGKTRHLDGTQPLAAALDAVEAGMRRSIANLGELRLHALLVHRVDDLLAPAGGALFERLQAIQAQGLTGKIGASVYTPAEVALLLERFPIDIIQLPINVFDQRMLSSGMLGELRRRKVEVHARSAFLQGVLLIRDPALLPAGLAELRPALARFRNCLDTLGLSALEGTLGFLKSLNAIDVAVCGATCLGEWQEISSNFSTLPDLPPETFKDFTQTDVNLIDPRRWRR